MALIDDCLFCKIIRQEVPASVVYEDDLVIAFDDINPQAPAHTLIVPKDHIATLEDLLPKHEGLLNSLFVASRRVAKKKGVNEDGYRLVLNCHEQAGQSVFHIHMHLLGGRALGWPPG